MSTTTLPSQRKRDRLRSILPGRSKPSTATVLSSSSQNSQPCGPVASILNHSVNRIPSQSALTLIAAPSSQVASFVVPATASSTATTSSSTNPAFLAAIQKHLDKLSIVERQAFLQAHTIITPDSLLGKVGSLDKQHASTSSFRPHAEKITRFLSLLDRLLGGVAIAIQANPDVSSIAVGGMKLIVDIAVGFTRYFGKLTNMLDRLSEIIAPLERYAERFELLNVGNALIDVYGDILDFCKASSTLFLDKNGRSKIPTTLKIFLHQQWEPFETEFGDIAGRMDSHCNVLLHAAQAELLYADKGKFKEREDFLRWLSPYDFHHKQKQTLKSKHKGTGDWLLQTSEFVRWVREPSSQILWCHGKPGAGKSVLASHVINHIEQNYVRKQTGLCFAYFSFTDPNFQEATLLIALFLKQLCQQRGLIPERLLEAKRQARDPTSVSDIDVFISVTELYQQIFVVLDGLDECPEEKRSLILDFILEASSISKSNVKMLVSSRKEYDINDKFKRLSTPAIELETGTITPDIRSFVQHEASRLRAESKLHVRDDGLFEEIVQKLVEKSDGMFLWVSLQLQQLCRTSRAENDRHLKQSLDHLPQGLVAMYTRIFDEIASGPVHARNVALECFRWIMYAKRRLPLHVLRAAVALSETPCTAEDMKSRLLPNEYILEACRYLLRLPNDVSSASYAWVTPSHFSFLEYLRSLPLDKLEGCFWDPLADHCDAQAILACRCIDWLLLELPQDLRTPDDQVAAWSYLCYPIACFDYHAIRAISRSRKIPASLLASINRILRANAKKLAFLVDFRLVPTPMGQRALGPDFDERLSRNYLMWTTDLYLLPGLDSDWTNLEIPRYALHFAVWFRPENLNYLISNGSYVNECDGDGRTPLSYACAKGRTASVEVLLRAGATFDAHYYQANPLGVAIQNNHLELTRMLIQVDVNPNPLVGARGRVPLMKATSLEMVKLLCDAQKSDINAVDNVGRSVLAYFVGYDSPPYIRYVEPAEATCVLDYLTSRGANQYAESKAGMNLIDYAASGVDCVDQLEFLLQLNSGLVDMKTQGWTSLHWACKKGNLRIARLLLKHGLEVKKVTTPKPAKCWTPYDILVHHGFRGIAAFQDIDESILYALGRPKDIPTIAVYHNKRVDYDALATRVDRVGAVCSLCAMQFETGFLFKCATCNDRFCLMCNHTMHDITSDHIIRTLYHFGIDHVCNVNGRYTNLFALELAYAFDLERPDWQEWFKRLKDKLVEQEHENNWRWRAAPPG